MLVLPMAIFGQVANSGVITYSEVTKTDWTPPADMDPAMRAQIEEMRKKMPKTFTNFRELTFNPEFAYYKVAPKQEKIDAERTARANAEGHGVEPELARLGRYRACTQLSLRRRTWRRRDASYDVQQQLDPLLGHQKGEICRKTGVL